MQTLNQVQLSQLNGGSNQPLPPDTSLIDNAIAGILVETVINALNGWNGGL